MAYYYLKQAFAAVDVLAIYSNLEATVGNPLAVELWATNDRLQPLAGYRCRYRITDVRGKLLAEEQVPAEVPAEGNMKIGDIQWRPPMEMASNAASCGSICSTPRAKLLPGIFTRSAFSGWTPSNRRFWPACSPRRERL